MMYNNKLVCSVKVNNKILREKHQDGNAYVYLPFGCEYSLALKNLSGKNAVVNIEIDGKEVSQGGFYIRAGQSFDVERFVEDLNRGRRFKFIEKTQEISDHRGDRVDDGMVRLTWQFEADKPEVKEIEYKYRPVPYPHPPWIYCSYCRNWHYEYEWCGSYQKKYYWDNPWKSVTIGSSTSRDSNITYTSSGTFLGSSGGTQSSSSCFHVQNSSPEYGEGITVKGSESNQKFGTAYADKLESNVHSMVILLRGFADNNANFIRSPITVRSKRTCSSCGRKWKSNIDFCPKDGTSLVE